VRHALALVVTTAAGCSTPSAPAPTPASPTATPAAPAVADAAALAAIAPAAERDEVVMLTDLAVLAEIDKGVGFAARVDAAAWDGIAEVLAGDVRAAGKADRDAGVGVRGHSHRLFDARWLDEPRFALAGVASRIERTPLGGCGRVAFLYRLRHAGSPLPLAGRRHCPGADDGAGCRTVAKTWRPATGLSPEAQARWLLRDGALAHLGDVATVQVNLQLVRWPSAVRPDLGGHAEYLLRTFKRDGARFIAAPVDNVPDVARIRRDKTLRAELLAWIRDRDTLGKVDVGWVQLPVKFLADRAISVAPRGFARRANRPFRQLVSPDELSDIRFDGLRTVRSAEALLRRLDQPGCAGCHQARTIAGFHLLGEDQPGMVAANALAVPVSGHVLDEVARRKAIVHDLATGAEPDWRRPFAERGSDGAGGWGSRCGLGDPGFADWTCGAGLVCDRYDAPTDDAAVGVCVPSAPQVGDLCEPGAVTANADPHRDSIPRRGTRACAEGQVCNRTAVGFPGGMCTAQCDALPAEGACGAIAVLTPFNQCLARREPFATCLAENVSPAGLRACDAARPCREDYICARGATPGQGVCIPPYFLFQLRVDGHP